MVLQLKNNPVIENVRNHSAETVEQLRALLAHGTPAEVDPHHANFYELENGSKVFYVNIVPGQGRVLLLATWPKDTSRVVEYERAAD